MKRSLPIILTVLVLFTLLLPFSASAQEDAPLVVVDEADVLTDQQAEELAGISDELYAAYGIKVVMVLVQSTNGEDAEDFADDYYDQYFYDKGYPDGVLFLISMTERDLYISTAGRAIEIFTDARVEQTLDDIYYATVDDGFYAACKTFCNDCRSLFSNAFDVQVEVVQTEAGLVPKESAEALVGLSQDIFRDYGIKVLMVVTDSLNGSSAASYANDYYQRYFQSSYPDCVLMLLPIRSRDLFITTYGNATESLSDSSLYAIYEDVTSFSESNNFSGACRSFCDGTRRELDVYRQELLEQKQAKHRRLITSFILAPILGFLVALIPIRAAKQQLQAIRSKNDAADYFGPDKLRMKVHRDQYLYSNTVQRVIETENRGSSGGGFSGGHSGSIGGGGSSTHVSSSGVTHGGGGRKF